MRKKVKFKGEGLTNVLSEAIRQLVGEEVTVTVDGLPDVEMAAIFCQLEANFADDEPDDDDDKDDDDGRQESSRASSRKESTPSGDDEEGDAPSLDDEADAAADFVEGILDAMDLPGELKIRVNDEFEEIDVEVVGVEGGALIGRRGQTLEAIQELLRSAMQREFQRRSRVRVDVEGYRARRLEKMLEKAEDAIDDALESGESQRLEPMDVFERKAVHRLVASYDGVSSRSQGRKPGRRIVIDVE